MFSIFMPLTLLCFLPFTGFQKEDISRTHSRATSQKTMLITGDGINMSLLDYEKSFYIRLSENVDIQTYHLSFCGVYETHESDIQIDDECEKNLIIGQKAILDPFWDSQQHVQSQCAHLFKHLFIAHSSNFVEPPRDEQIY